MKFLKSDGLRRGQTSLLKQFGDLQCTLLMKGRLWYNTEREKALCQNARLIIGVKVCSALMDQRKNVVRKWRMTDLLKSGLHASGSSEFTKLAPEIAFSFNNCLMKFPLARIGMTFVLRSVCALPSPMCPLMLRAKGVKV